MPLVQLSQNEDMLTSRNQEKKFFFLGKKNAVEKTYPCPSWSIFCVFFSSPFKNQWQVP